MILVGDDWPRYTLPKELADGTIAYYWSPTDKALADSGIARAKLGTDVAAAKKKADDLNADLDYWKIHKRHRDDPAPNVVVPGSIDHVFEVYKAANPSKRRSYLKLKPSQQADYARFMKRFADYTLKDGRRLGRVMAKQLDRQTVDLVYEKLLYDDAGKPRRRVTNHVMAVCRRAWGVAIRARPEIMPGYNPFEDMDLDHSSAETLPANYAQLVAFEAKAAELDLPEIAFAARAAWELLQRVEEICTTFSWTHWRPADHAESVFVRFAKKDTPVWKPLGDDKGSFYPELEERLKAVPKRGALVLVHNATKGRKKKDGSSVKPVYRPYSPRFMQKRARDIRIAAELPAYVTMESFRHGGLTELGDAGLPDTWAQAQSRHKQRATLDRYIHRSDVQQKAGARMRVAYRRGET
jgi:hypothetical protein